MAVMEDIGRINLEQQKNSRRQLMRDRVAAVGIYD
jgi:hypothetical protein